MSANLIAASRELTTALRQHRDLAVAPELHEQLSGFVATLLATIVAAGAAQEEGKDGDRA